MCILTFCYQISSFLKIYLTLDFKNAFRSKRQQFSSVQTSTQFEQNRNQSKFYSVNLPGKKLILKINP